MTGAEVDALVEYIATLEADLTEAHRRIQDLEFEVEECRAWEAAHEAAVQDRVARLIEHRTGRPPA
ncbi:hypothetical protein [Methylobacterium oryzisoli]|uniref:hypothetical protein n=1 Tax=Methylobacterium oryzisoli TaxID=3385502 RepID=UPI003891FDDB